MITRIVTAHEYEEYANAPETLYKYRDWNAPFHNSILTRREVFFAAPNTFMDPLDCKNPVRYDLLSKKEINQLYANRLNSEQGMSRQARRLKARELNRNSNVRNKEFVEKHNEETFNEYCKRAGVLSLTADPLNVRMWEKYSDKHQGFCVGFDTKIASDFFGAAGPVFYDRELPIIYPEPKHSFLKQHITRIFHKEEKWAFEKEYRTHKFMGHPMSIKDRTVKLPPEAYKEVILGARMPEMTKQDISNSLPDELKHLPIKQASFLGNGEIKIL